MSGPNNRIRETLLELSGESTVMVEELMEQPELVRMIREGKGKDECLAWINENF